MRPAAAALLTVAVLLATVAAGASAATPGDPADAIVVVSGPVEVPAGEAVEGVFLVDGDAVIGGEVDGDVWVLAGDATVSGRIEGDLVTASGRAELLPGGEVAGDLLYGDEEPTLSPRATVEGEVRKEGWEDVSPALPWIGAFALWLAVSFSSLALGAVLVLIAPRAADAIAAEARARLPLAIAIGLATFLALPIAAVAAAVTLVGLPLGVGILLAMLPLGAIAYVAAAHALGRAILSEQSPIVAFLVGLAILRAVALVPVLGVLAGLAAVVVGLGLIALAIEAAREPRPAVA
jgi:cytoskeletal protein CcmA (bactofilin family)